MEKREYSEAGMAIRDVMQVSPIAAWLGGIVGALLGGVFGWFAFGWLYHQGYYGLALPGALVGLGFGFLSRRPMISGGVFCAVVAAVLMLFCEAVHRPFNKDESLGYFFANLSDLTGMTWVFLVIGVLMAFWFGRGR